MSYDDFTPHQNLDQIRGLKKSVWYMDFNYQSYYLRKKYHFISLFIHKVAWVKKTKNFESVLKTRHLR